MAAVAAIAVIPDRISKIFGTAQESQFINGLGFFDVNLFVLGAPITIRVDDTLAAYNSYSQTLMAKIVNKAVWVSILDKAYAKLNGNYSGLIAGLPQNAIQSILGVSGISYILAYYSPTAGTDLWNWITAAKPANILVANSRMTTVQGIIPNQAYTFINNWTINQISGPTF